MKTGSTDDYRDSWTLGYTPSLLAGVWVGNSDGRPMRNVLGSSGAGAIWHEFMERALEGTPVEPPRMLRDDEMAEQEPSSFDRESPLRAVPLTDLVGFASSDVYAVEPAGLAAGLYETAFNYRKSFLAKEALLLVKSDTEAYLLVGVRKQLNFLGRQVAYEFFDAAEGADEGVDPLDFSVM